MADYFKKIFKTLRRQKNIGKSFLDMERVWKIELAAAAVLLVFMLAFNFWVYKTFVSEIKEAASPEEAEGFVFLDKSGLVEANDAVETYGEFLENPEFSALPNNPF